MLVLVENAKEHLFRLFIDWPKLFDLKTSNNELPYLSQIMGEFKAALFQNSDAFSLGSKLNEHLKDTDQLIDKLDQYLQQHVFCQSTKNWLEIKDIQVLHRWANQCDSIAANSIGFICDQGWASQGLTDCEQLPQLDVKNLLNQFSKTNADQFIAEPQWQGHCFETTTLTRQFEQPLIQSLYKEFHATLITRWVARLVELARIPDQLRMLQQQLIDTIKTSSTINSQNKKTVQGIAHVEAARGRLIHHVSIEHGVISKYQILAPTEWNFHPQGLLAKSLSSITPSDLTEGNAPNNRQNDALEKLAHLMINAIDPCVGYQLRIH